MVGNIVGGIASMGGQMMAGQQAGQGETEAQNLRNLALQQLMQIEVPDIELMNRNYLVPEMVGEYNPEMEQALGLGASAMEDVAVDPRLASSQYSALEQLAGLADGGLSTADLGALEQIRRQSAAQDQAKQGQILQQMQQRGQGGSGAELIARLKSAQSSADRSSQEGLTIAQQAQQRALQALMNQGNMATTMRSQDVGEQSDIARAKDVISKFNVANQQNVGQRNVSSQNQSQQQNLANRQAIENQRANIRNREQDVNKGLYQQRFQNEMTRQAPITGQQNSNAGNTQQIGYARAERTKEMADSFGDMAGGMGGMGM
ncbi:MAG: hypothetical protein COB41_00445 [Proteobacteria bacterium]|nr:MAG: hypothetical protein COB41_00445 [Pseudomonadota bacterium]